MFVFLIQCVLMYIALTIVFTILAQHGIMRREYWMQDGIQPLTNDSEDEENVSNSTKNA
jgi:hypothetical protein